MLSPDVTLIIAAMLAALCVGGIVISMLYARLARRSEAAKRFAAVANWDGPADRVAGTDENNRKRSIETALRTLEEQQKAKKGVRPSLVVRLRQAGLSWSKRTYVVACFAAGGLSFLFALAIFGVSPVPALGFGLAGGLVLPHLYVTRRRAGRLKDFTAEFPNAVDVIVRGVKAGLPLVDCLRMIAMEAKEPVRGEFRAILDDQTLGVPIDQAVQRLVERIPVPEANFFAIVISLQSRSGGNLSEALGNLSRVLRERKKMAGKIRAMSSEAKTSAGIIGALPLVVSCALYLSAPDYISLLFTTLMGKMVLAGAAIWMGIGVLMMRKMINFEF
jgi:tight adherence protein B